MQTDIGLIAHGPTAIGALCQLREHFIDGALYGVGYGPGDTSRCLTSINNHLNRLAGYSKIASDAGHCNFSAALEKF